MVLISSTDVLFLDRARQVELPPFPVFVLNWDNCSMAVASDLASSYESDISPLT